MLRQADTQEKAREITGELVCARIIAESQVADTAWIEVLILQDPEGP